MHRFNIKIRSSVDMLNVHVMNRLFQRMHDILVKKQDGNSQVKIGIGFPDYSLSPRTLGNTLSLFGDKKELESINIKDECKDIAQYLVVGEIKEAKDTGEYYSFRRLKLRHSPENRIRRAMKRKGYSLEEAREKYDSYVKKGKPEMKCPYVYFQSKSTGQSFPFLIKKEKVEKMADKFNTFGLDFGQIKQGVPV